MSPKVAAKEALEAQQKQDAITVGAVGHAVPVEEEGVAVVIAAPAAPAGPIPMPAPAK